MSRIKVYAKIRQPAREEVGENLRVSDNEILISNPDGSDAVANASNGAGLQSKIEQNPRHSSNTRQGIKFKFEQVYKKETKGEEIYGQCVQHFIDAYMDYGYNVTYLILGESDSGQLEALFGEESKGLLKGKKDYGIVPGMVDDLFEKFFRISNESADRRNQEQGSRVIANDRIKQKYILKLAVVEVEKEIVKDLLFLRNQDGSSNKDVPVPNVDDDELEGIGFKNITTLEVRQASDCNSLIQDALAKSAWCEMSKREDKTTDNSTFVLQFELARVFQGFSEPHKSWFRVIKLPGAELLVSNTAELDLTTHHDTIKSMQSFGNIVKDLSGRSFYKVANYTEFVLTKLLSDSLGGNSITSCLLTLKQIQTPAITTILSYGDKLQKIKNHPIENTPYAKNLLRRYRWVMRNLQESSIQEKRLDGALIAELKDKISSLTEGLLKSEEEKEQLKEDKLIAENNLIDFERKLSELHSARTELSSRMVFSEQEKLKMSKTVIDLQLECNRISQEAERQVYELKDKSSGLQEKISDLERHVAFEKRSRQDVKEQFNRTEQDYKDITEEYINLKRNYVSLTEAHDQQLHRNEKLGLEIAAAIESRNYTLETKDRRELQRIEELTSQLRSIAGRLSTGSQTDKEKHSQNLLGLENQKFNLEERLLLSAKERETRIDDLQQQYDEELRTLENNLIIVKEDLKQSKVEAENHRSKMAEQNAELLILRHQNQYTEEETAELKEKLRELSAEYTKRLEKYIMDLKDYLWVDRYCGDDIDDNGKSNLELKRQIEQMLEGYKNGCDAENRILINRHQKLSLQAEDIVRRHEKLLTVYKILLWKTGTEQKDVKDLKMLEISLPPDSEIKAAQVKERNELQMRAYVAEQTIKDLQDRIDSLKSELMQNKGHTSKDIEISENNGNLDWHSIRGKMREFTLNVQQDLEKERSALITRCQLSEQQLLECQDYIDTYLKRYQQEIIHLRKLLAQHGRPQSAEMPLALENESRKFLPPLQDRMHPGRTQRR